MKSVQAKLLTLIMALALLILTACSNGSEPGGSTPPPPSDSEPDPASSSPGNGEETATATFSLYADGSDVQAMGVGDRIGDWVLANLEITYVAYGEEEVMSVSALFEGTVTLGGTLTRAPFEGHVYDFTVAKEQETKMPHYIAPERDSERDFVFRMNFVESMEEMVADMNYEVDEGKDCVITISDYRCIVSPYSAPSSATVVDMKSP